MNRRAFLRGVLGGTAVTLALPHLESFWGRGARAASGAPAKRFGMFFWGNGVLPEKWIPPSAGSDWTLSEQLAGLESVRDVISVISGLEVKTGNPDPHISGPAGFLTGMPSVQKPGGDWTFAGPTLDQLIAAEIGGETLYRSIEVGVQPGLRGLSHNGPNSQNPPETDLARLWDKLFGPTFRAPGDDSEPDPRLALRRSVLDSVLEDAKALKPRLGRVDKERLEQHLTAVRDLEQRIARLQEDPPNLAACSRPGEPPGIDLLEGRPQMTERTRALADLLAMSLACDQTRVFSMWYSDPVSDVLYPQATMGHHQLTHDEPAPQAQVHEIVKQVMSDFGVLVEALRAVPEGEGTLLDGVALLGTTDVSYGRTHQIDEYPILIAGSACGALRTGFHYRSTTKESTSLVALSLLRAMDLNAASYGADAGRVEEGLSVLAP